MIKFIELFGGIGACTEALKRLNIDYEIVDYVEIDKYAVASYNAINGTHFETQDIRNWNKDIDVDLIMHGSPCQDFSLAGYGKGGDEGSGTRSSLMYETIRIVNNLKPKYVIWENVKNILSKKHKHNFDNYLKCLEYNGYTNYWQVLNAKNYGIPQNRERVFTISIRNDIDTDKGFFYFPQKQELKLRLKDLLEDEVDEKYFIKKALNIIATPNYIQWSNSGKMQNSQAERGYYIDNECMCTISHCNTNGDKTQICEPVLVKNKGQEIVKQTNIATTLLARGYKGLGNQVGNGVIDNSFIYIKNANSKGYDEATEGDSIDLTYPNSTTRRGRVGHQVSQTIPASDTKGVVSKDLRIRKLTPKECWRLMGFTDEEFEKASQVNSNTQLYKQARKLNSCKRASRDIKELIEAR